MPGLADYVIDFIAQLGMKHVFLAADAAGSPLAEAIERRPALEPVFLVHEQAAAIAAENYSKATNDFGVALITSFPGVTNAITGLAGAWLDSTPCLFISVLPARAEIDILAVVESLTKKALCVDRPESIQYFLEKAVYWARHGRPGPVWIDIPPEILAAELDPARLEAFLPPDKPRHSVADAVSRAIDALNRSERPLVLAGNGIRLARAEAEFGEALDLLDIPLETTWFAIDLVPQDDPYFVGRPGSVAQRGANFAVQNCDFLLALGARLDRVVTGFAPERFARAAHKVMVDVDPSELRKMGDTIQEPILADAGEFLRELKQQAGRIVRKDRADWKKRCAEWKCRYPLVTDEHRQPGTRVSIYHLSEVLGRELAEGDCIVSGSAGSGIEIFLLALHVKKGQRVFHTTALGGMGFGIAASIAVCLANDGKQVVCVDGDGGFQFNIQELETVARLQLPIKFFVLNNAGYASIRASQTSFFGAPLIGCDDATGQSLPDLSQVAGAYGIATHIIRDQSNLRAEIRGVLDRPGPVVCDLHVILDEERKPRLSSIQRPDGSFVSKPLEDLYPFLDREEFRSNMLIPVLDE